MGPRRHRNSRSVWNNGVFAWTFARPISAIATRARCPAKTLRIRATKRVASIGSSALLALPQNMVLVIAWTQMRTAAADDPGEQDIDERVRAQKVFNDRRLTAIAV
jgi:hypothetical protein